MNQQGGRRRHEEIYALLGDVGHGCYRYPAARFRTWSRQLSSCWRGKVDHPIRTDVYAGLWSRPTRVEYTRDRHRFGPELQDGPYTRNRAQFVRYRRFPVCDG